MADVIFIQRARIGRSIFYLRGEYLEVDNFNFGWKGSRRFPLRSINPDYVHGARRFHLLYLLPLAFLGVCFGLVHLILSQDILPHGMITWPAMFVASGVWAAFRGVGRVEYFAFSDHWNRPLFYVVREESQTMECEAFLHELLDRIEQAEHGPTVGGAAFSPGPTPSAVSLPRADDDFSFFDSGEHRWKASIVAGAVSAGFPFFVRAVPSGEILVYPAVILATIGALLFGVLSFLAKERLKFFALAGMALSLVAPIFY